MTRPLANITIGGYKLKSTEDCYRRWRFTRDDRVIRNNDFPGYLYVTSSKNLRARLARAGYDRTSLELDFLRYLQNAAKAGEMPFYFRDDICDGRYSAREQMEAFRGATLDDWLFALKEYITNRCHDLNAPCRTSDSASRSVDVEILIGLIARDDFLFDGHIELQHGVKAFPCSGLDNMAVAMLEVLPETAECVLDVSELVLSSRAYSFDDLILGMGGNSAAAHFARIIGFSEQIRDF
jgi:hypothetical protein